MIDMRCLISKALQGQELNVYEVGAMYIIVHQKNLHQYALFHRLLLLESQR